MFDKVIAAKNALVGKVKGAKNALVGKVKGAIKSIKFLFSPIGQIIGFLILIAICALILYIMIAVLVKSIAGWLGIELGGIATDSDYEILEQIKNNGYEAFIDAEQVQEYAAFEYAVLMDVARNIEETGVWEGKEIHSGSQDCATYTSDTYRNAILQRNGVEGVVGATPSQNTSQSGGQSGTTGETTVDTGAAAGDGTTGGGETGSGEEAERTGWYANRRRGNRRAT